MPDPKTRVERAGTRPFTEQLTPEEQAEEASQVLTERASPATASTLLSLVARVQRLEGVASAARREGVEDVGAVTEELATLQAQLDESTSFIVGLKVVALEGRNRTITNTGQGEWETGSQNFEWRELIARLESR